MEDVSGILAYSIDSLLFLISLLLEMFAAYLLPFLECYTLKKTILSVLAKICF